MLLQSAEVDWCASVLCERKQAVIENRSLQQALDLCACQHGYSPPNPNAEFPSECASPEGDWSLLCETASACPFCTLYAEITAL